MSADLKTEKIPHDSLKKTAPQIGFRNACNNVLLAIPDELLSESLKRFQNCDEKENLLVEQVKAKKTLKYKNRTERADLCSEFDKSAAAKPVSFSGEKKPGAAENKPPPRRVLLPKRKNGGENRFALKLPKVETAQKRRHSLEPFGAKARNGKEALGMAGMRGAEESAFPMRKMTKNGDFSPGNDKNEGNEGNWKNGFGFGGNGKNEAQKSFYRDVKTSDVKSDAEGLAKVEAEGNKEMKLSSSQEKILEHVLSGKNVFFTGCAGTGKSVLLREISRILEKRKVKIAVTASTGLAASSLNGKTLHSWSGIGLGKSSAEFLCRKIRAQVNAYARWLETKVLIVDEISMISGVIFDKIETIAKKMRRSSLPFGGIQLILCGDFMQLPPVNKAERLTFESSSWQRCIPDNCIFELTEVFRQRDAHFIKILSELRFGFLSKETELALSQTAKNDLPEDTVVIYSHRKMVSMRNAKKLKSLRGEGMMYIAEDTFPGLTRDSKTGFDNAQNLLANCPIPYRLALKVGAPVILMKNLDKTFVNGLSGVVMEFRKEGEDGETLPVINFKSIGRTVCLERIQWKSERADGSTLASRKQIPLELGWALTIHKCQGMTLDNAVMNLGSVWEPGHFYVAVSRLRTLEGLKIVGNFSKCCVKVDSKVLAWMRNKGVLKEQTPAEPQSESERENFKKEVSNSKVSQITRPFVTNNLAVNDPLEFQQKRALEDKSRRKGVSVMNGAPKRRFSITEAELRHLDSIVDDLDRKY